MNSEDYTDIHYNHMSKGKERILKLAREKQHTIEKELCYMIICSAAETLQTRRGGIIFKVLKFQKIYQARILYLAKQSYKNGEVSIFPDKA